MQRINEMIPKILGIVFVVIFVVSAIMAWNLENQTGVEGEVGLKVLLIILLALGSLLLWAMCVGICSQIVKWMPNFFVILFRIIGYLLIGWFSVFMIALLTASGNNDRRSIIIAIIFTGVMLLMPGIFFSLDYFPKG